MGRHEIVAGERGDAVDRAEPFMHEVVETDGEHHPIHLRQALQDGGVGRMREEANSLRVIDIFKEWDEDGDGQISVKEFRRALPMATGIAPTQPKPHPPMQHADYCASNERGGGRPAGVRGCGR